MRGVYAYECTDCGHLASVHTLAEDGDLRAGPYRCATCGCEQPQDGAFIPLSRREYEARHRAAAGPAEAPKPETSDG